MIKLFFPATAVVFSLILLSPLGESAEEETLLAQMEEEIIKVAEKASPAVVSVSTESISPFWWNEMDRENFPAWIKDFLTSDFGSRKRRSTGTGFIISPDGKILTTSDVIDHAQQITVGLNDGRLLPAQVLGQDSIFGIAVLQIEAENLDFLSLNEDREVKTGSWVIALGQPLGLPTSASWGIVSGLGRTGLGITPYEELLQITAPINPGDSGGPVLNIRGDVIGVIAGTYTGYREMECDWDFIRRFNRSFPNAAAISPEYFFRSSQAHGIGFAIPIGLVKDIIEKIITGLPVKYGWLGIYPEAIPGGGGTTIAALAPAGPAKQAGLTQGDIILSVNGLLIQSPQELQKLVLFTTGGTELNFEIKRAGEIMTLTVVAGERSHPVNNLN